MDKPDKPLRRRDFIRAVGGTLVATELGLAGCGDAEPSAPSGPSEPTQAGPGNVTGAGTQPVAGTPVGDNPTMGSSGSPPAGQEQASAGGQAAGSETPAQSGSMGDGSGADTPSTDGPMTGVAGSPAQPQTPVDDGRARVYVIKTSDRSEGILQALTMFGGLGFAAGRDVVLKPNFNSQYEFPATTHDDTIRTIVGQLKAANAGAITLADSAGATTGSRSPTATVIQAKGTVALCADIGIEFQSFDDAEFETFEFEGMTWSGGLAIPKLMRSDRVKILLPCCKTHVLADYTFSMKLAAGLPERSRRGLISDMHTSLHEKVVDINMGFTPDLVVMDAMECFIDGGPDSGTKAAPGLIVAATDRVALDAVGVAILKAAGSTSAPIRGQIFETRQMKRAVEIGLGISSPDEIELIGNDDATIAELRSILDMG